MSYRSYLQCLMLSENAGSGMAFFKKFSMDFRRAALCGKHIGPFIGAVRFDTLSPCSSVSTSTEVPGFTSWSPVCSPEVAAVSVSIGIMLSSIEDISICDGEAGCPSKLTVDSLRATRITNGCSFLQISTSFWKQVDLLIKSNGPLACFFVPSHTLPKAYLDNIIYCYKF